MINIFSSGNLFLLKNIKSRTSTKSIIKTMRNKGFVIFLTIIVTLLCVYYLSFTFVSRNVQRDAIAFATDPETGSVDYFKKQSYLDSVWREPVFRLLGMDYTFQDVKNTELNLGLDLQGGMHVTLEVSPVEIIKGLSNHSEDRAFLQAIERAKVDSRTSQESFVNLFYRAYKDIKPDGRLSNIFATVANRNRITSESSDAEVLKVINNEVENAIERSFNILRTRVDRFGTSQPNIQRLQGTGRIQVELPGADNPERVRKLLQGVAKLEFWEVWEVQEYGNSLQAANDLLVAEQKRKQKDAPVREPKGTTADNVPQNISSPGDDQGQMTPQPTDPDSLAEDLASQLAQGEDKSGLDSLAREQQSPLLSLLKPSYGLAYNVADTAKVNRILQRSDVISLFPANLKFLWAHKPYEANGEQILELYAVKVGRDGRAPLTGEVITDARQDYDDSSRPAVSMQMNATGAKKWRRLTQDNIKRRIAIVLDDYVYSAPTVQGEIPGGNSSISGNFTIEEAKDLANVLKAGTLPAPTRIVEEAIVGPTLGKEAQNQGIYSIVAGLAIVVLFMIAYYAKGGIVANVALVFNIFFVLGILAQLNAALTLPGIAGIVLTIGMAIDANVLIFERIREELRKGQGLKGAIASGYDKAFSSIVDSNITTFLTGVILYVLGQGPVQGFAVTLMIGIACSFFSAVFITRVIVEFMARKGDASKLSFATPFTNNVLANINIDFLSKRKLAYVFSSVFIVTGFVVMLFQGGLNFGVDFTGGRSYVVAFSEPVPSSELRAEIASAFGDVGTEVKTYGANNVLKVTTSYLIDDEDTEADVAVESALINAISQARGMTYTKDTEQLPANSFSILSSSKVGATIADDIRTSSMEAIVLSLVVIFLYIVMRFRKWQFGLGALVALFHDTLFVLAAFAIARLFGFTYEVDQVFIAAMLTIIGYSINDTVIVFDRIREDVSERPKSDLTQTFNLAINNTVSRTVITSLTTLMVMLVLLTFGGEALRSFSFAMVIGILVGTYSSIFVATPVVVDLSAKKKENAKVKQQPAMAK
jgi:SecD/SecF fusion protein